MTSNDEKNPLSSINVFVLKKSIDSISKEYESISQLRDGSILILTKNKRIADKFKAVTKITDNCPVTVKYHDRLNSCKGIVFAPILINVPEKEIVDEMATQGITAVYKFTKNIEGKQRPTGLMLFTFDLYKPPPTVEMGFYREKVKEYIPNPMRCRKCQILGHTIKWCTREEVCATCNLQPHDNAPESCTRVMCANCPQTEEPHPSSSNKCPKYIKNKDILTIKTRNKCSMAEARLLYYNLKPNQENFNITSFNEKAKTGNISALDNAISLEKRKTIVSTSHSNVQSSSSSSLKTHSSSSLLSTSNLPPKSSTNVQNNLSDKHSTNNLIHKTSNNYISKPASTVNKNNENTNSITLKNNN
ncbi:uncharacterized protein LOC129906964 [Episyrphus balteatus]|uniref:uncharacterized protein LOC129906964 n=1 Tax=Episyrphus balteatus TaxID=286459 RepID=UPI0024854724|nr:uncharacterized protein LOC129906964 [Episyrphus balteatus]